MMKTKQIFFTLLLMICCWSFGYSTIEHFYIEIKKTNIEIGTYKKEKRLKRKKLANYTEQNINLIEITELLDLGVEQNVLFYFHAMWGSGKLTHGNSLKKLEQMDSLDRMVSIIWHTEALGYKKAWRKAIDQGRRISPIIEALMQSKTNRYSVLCHSMGHRIFEGVVKEMTDLDRFFHTIFFAAADLDVNVFSKNLAQLPVRSQKIIVYINEKDRLLRISKWMHHRDRLGLHAAEYQKSLRDIPNLEIVNVTNAKSPHYCSVSNHIYIFKHQSVIRDMNLVIAGAEVERKSFFKLKDQVYIELK